MSLVDRIMGRFFKPTPLDQIVDPGPESLKRMTPRDLARYKAGWAPGTEHWILADAEQRRREGWSGPVKLSLGFSFLALLISLAALLTD